MDSKGFKILRALAGTLAASTLLILSVFLNGWPAIAVFVAGVTVAACVILDILDNTREKPKKRNNAYDISNL